MPTLDQIAQASAATRIEVNERKGLRSRKTAPERSNERSGSSSVQLAYRPKRMKRAAARSSPDGDRGKRMILHALGLAQVRRWSYRNYIAGCDETCEPLVEAGWMIRGRVINQETQPLQLYHVTDDGARSAGVFNRFRLQDRLLG